MRRKLIGNWAVSHGPDSKVLILAVVYLCLSDRVTIDKENTDSIPAMVQCTTDPFRVCNTCRRLRASFVRSLKRDIAFAVAVFQHESNPGGSTQTLELNRLAEATTFSPN
jgi:hypothetical protein